MPRAAFGLRRRGCNQHSDANTGSSTYANSDTHSDANANADTHAYPDTHSDAYANSDTHAYPDTYTYTYTYTYTLTTPTPPPTISFVRPPAPTDTIGYNDAEYRASNGPIMHGAATAWVGGHTGQGSIIGIVDTGIFQANSEFAGRISPDSTDIFSSRNTLEGEGDHGTLVAMVAAAANDGVGTVGIAYNATILAVRSDDPGTCAKGSCSFGDISDSIIYAVDHGATVINVSLGGSGASAAELSAVQYAAEKGVVIVLAAGNDGNKRPDAFARNLASIGNGNVLIVGAVSSSGTLASFSNGARGSTDYYLAALGQRVSVYLNGPQWANDPDCPSPTMCSIDGTSFSAPQVSGAVALLKQAFPNLTGQQIVSLLLATAQDVGDPGVDDVYGHGILDIYEAFQPQGTTTLATSKTAAIPLGDTSAVGSPAMGNALTTASLKTVVLDGYHRAYSYNLGSTMRSATLSSPLFNAVGGQMRYVSSGNEQASVAFSIDDSGGQARLGSPRQLMLSTQDAEIARVLAARIALKLSPDTQIGFGYAESSAGLVMQLQGQERPAFLVAQPAGSGDGTLHRSDMSFALRKRFGSWGLTLSADSGSVLSGNNVYLAQELYGRRAHDATRDVALAVDRRWGPVATTLSLDWMGETRTVLGARFHDAFGGGGANTLFADASASWELTPSLHLLGAIRNGWTYADHSSVIVAGSVIQSRAWSLDLEKSGVFGAADRLGIRIAQPLRVESGGLNLYLPIAYSYDTQSATFGNVPLSLSPDGREIMGEVAWHGPLWGGGASASLYYRRDPGHYASLPDDKGVALRWQRNF